VKLSELYQERMAANPDLTRKMLVEAVGSATVYAVQHDVPRKFRKGTLQKLAELWKCSTGDIQACLAEIDDPRRKPTKAPSVIETVDKLEQMVAPDPEEEPPVKVSVKMTAVEELTVEKYKAQIRDKIIRMVMDAEPDSPVSDLWLDIGRMLCEEVL